MTRSRASSYALSRARRANRAVGLVITRTIKLLGLAMLLGMLASTPGYAQSGDAIRQGVQIGTAIPHKLDVPDQTNQVQGFATMKKSRGLILIFSRSLSW
jgi:hypothetical protein